MLFLTNNYNTIDLFDWISSRINTFLISDALSLADVVRLKPELVISYNYSHIVTKDVIEYMNGKIINMHISYLPFNRGANPNFWSLMEGTPSGVTIHEMSEKLDSGKILLQEQVYFNLDCETLKSTYEYLHIRIKELLKSYFDELLNGELIGTEQIGSGSYHSLLDYKKIRELINFDYTDKVSDIKNKYDEKIVF